MLSSTTIVTIKPTNIAAFPSMLRSCPVSYYADEISMIQSPTNSLLPQHATDGQQHPSRQPESRRVAKTKASFPPVLSSRKHSVASLPGQFNLSVSQNAPQHRLTTTFCSGPDILVGTPRPISVFDSKASTTSSNTCETAAHAGVDDCFK
jgi:hypothetical protein